MTRAPCGFSLLELMAVVAIIAILVNLALPLYQKQSNKVRLLDGKNKLMEVMHLEQLFFARHLHYSDKLKDDLNLPVVDGVVLSDQGFYLLSAKPCESGLDECVQLVATPVDTSQISLSLDSLGRRSPLEIW